jgi:hypothetical protein
VVLPDSPKVPRVPGYSGGLQGSPSLFAYRALTVSGGASQPLPLRNGFLTPWRVARPPASSHNPHTATGAPWHGMGLGSTSFARRYLRSRGYFLLLRLLRWFSSPGALRINPVTGHHSRRVSPFGNPGIKACLLLPQAFRRLLRPSSASGPKASTLRRSLLSLFLNLKLH